MNTLIRSTVKESSRLALQSITKERRAHQEDKADLPQKSKSIRNGITIRLTRRSQIARLSRKQLVAFCRRFSMQIARQTRQLPTRKSRGVLSIIETLGRLMERPKRKRLKSWDSPKSITLSNLEESKKVQKKSRKMSRKNQKKNQKSLEPLSYKSAKGSLKGKSPRRGGCEHINYLNYHRSSMIELSELAI